MTFEEAIELLGITGDEDPKAVRRTYLRLLKKHPPERDPEGFKRLREAYESVKDRGPTFVQVAAKAPAEPPQPPAPADDPVESLRSALHESGDPEQHLEDAMELARTHTDREDAHELLVDMLEWNDAQGAQIVQALRNGASAGHRSMMERLALGHPETLSEEELEAHAAAAVAGDEPGEALVFARSWAERGRRDRAYELSMQALDASLARATGLPSQHEITAVAYTLYAQGDVQSASRLVLHWHTLARQAGALAPGAVWTTQAAELALLLELAELNNELPSEFQQAVAAALANGDPEEADLFIAGLSRWERRRIRKLLKRAAPALLESYASALAGSESVERGGTSTWPVFLVVMLLVQLFRFAISTSSSSSPEVSLADLERLQRRPTVFCVVDDAELCRASRSLRVLSCDAAHEKIAAMADRIEQLAEQGDLTEAQRTELQQALVNHAENIAACAAAPSTDRSP